METIAAVVAIALVAIAIIVPVATLAGMVEIRKALRDIVVKQARMAEMLRDLRDKKGVETTPPVPPAAFVPVVERTPLRAPVPPPVPLPVPSDSSAIAAPVHRPIAVRPPCPPSSPRLDYRPAVPTPTPRRTSEILRKVWCWVVYGREEKPTDVSIEFAVATTWLPRAAIIAISLGVVWFLRSSYAQEWIGPMVRVAVSVVVGLGMLVWGMKLLGRRYHLIGQGLLGGGLLVLYFSVFAALSTYHVIGFTAAFALMLLVTLTAGILAVRARSLLIALIGVAGAYLTPVLLRSPQPNLPGLYAYMTLISLGVLGIAVFRNWHILNYAGLLGTYGLFLGSLKVYRVEDFPVAMTFLCVLFVIQSLVSYIHNIVQGKKSTVPDVIRICANVLVFAGIGYHLIVGAHGRPYPALLAVGLSAFYVGHIVVFLRNQRADRALLVALLALAGASAAWALPLTLEKESLTLALSLLACMFLWIGVRMRSHFLENVSYAIYAVVLFRLLTMDLPVNFRTLPSGRVSLRAYWAEFLSRLWTFGTCIASGVAAYWIQSKEARARDACAEFVTDHDMRLLVERRSGAGVFGWAAFLAAFLVIHLELSAMFSYCAPYRLPALTGLWCAAAAILLFRFVRTDQEKPWLPVMAAFMAGAIVKLVFVDLHYWQLTERFVYGVPYNALTAGLRVLDFGFVALTCMAAWFVIRTSEGSSRRAAGAFAFATVAVVFLYATFEINSLLYWRLPAFQASGVSVLWALFAAGLLTLGILSNSRLSRYAGLLLFVVVVGKVFVVDLAGMAMIYRMVAFVVLGAALLLGSFAYIRFAGRFKRSIEPAAEVGQMPTGEA